MRTYSRPDQKNRTGLHQHEIPGLRQRRQVRLAQRLAQIVLDGIEHNMREAMGEENLPPLPMPHDYLLM